MVLEATARRAVEVEILSEWGAAAGVVFGLIGELAFDADGLLAEDGGRGGVFEVAFGEDLAGGLEAAVGAFAGFIGVAAAGVEGVGGAVWVGWHGECGGSWVEGWEGEWAQRR